MNPSVLVSDFDGTMTANEFYALVRAGCLAPGARDDWERYLRGEITHFEAMAGVYSHAPTDPAVLGRLLEQMQPDPDLGRSAALLRANGWDLIVASAGGSWYIERILAAAGIRAPVYANPGNIQPGRGLVLERPAGSRFYSEEIGVDKAAIVRDAREHYGRVAFAGDGPLDFDAAMLADPEYRFARGLLAGVMDQRKASYHRFTRWAEIAWMLAA
jgi:2-hydroxy-3-keto-5-methylthiopentenyl-1-phosphate phosphatase